MSDSNSEWGEDGWPIDTVDPFAPCPVCESVNRWQDLRGNWHCVRCKEEEGRRALANSARMLAVKEAAAKLPTRQRKPTKAAPAHEESHQDVIERAKRENKLTGD
jgi:hypothetical protein